MSLKPYVPLSLSCAMSWCQVKSITEGPAQHSLRTDDTTEQQVLQDLEKLRIYIELDVADRRHEKRRKSKYRTNIFRSKKGCWWQWWQYKKEYLRLLQNKYWIETRLYTKLQKLLGNKISVTAYRKKHQWEKVQSGVWYLKQFFFNVLVLVSFEF